MKRTQLKRTSSLRRAKAPLARSKPLSRGSAPLARDSREGRILSEETCLAVLAAHPLRSNGGLLLCACGCGWRVEPRNPACWHHVFAKHLFPELFDEPDNLVLLAVDCHSSHETAARRVPRRMIVRAERLATNPQRESYLDRTYGRKL